MNRFASRAAWAGFFLMVFGLSMFPGGLPPAEAASRDVQFETQSRQININKAGSEELQALRGVGPAIAARIVEYRDTNGHFESVDDLAKVKGIGQSKLDQMRPQVSL